MKLSLRFLFLVATFSSLTISAQEEDRQMDKVAVTVELAYWESGNPDGEPVLFLHGAVMADSFLRLMSEPALSNYRLIGYHRRGYGESTDYSGISSDWQQSGDAQTLLRHLGIQKAHWVGHSQSGLILFQAAAWAPEMVNSLTLLEGAINPLEEGFEYPEDFVLPEAADEEPVSDTDSADFDSPADQFMTDFVGANWESELEPYFPGVVEQVNNDIGMTFVQEFPGMGQPVDPEFYSRITQPTLYLISEYAPRWVSYPEQLLPIVIPHSEIQYLQDMGHEMQVMHPEPVAEVIADWLARHPIQ